MPEKNLKHYESYCIRLRTFSEAMNISVMYQDYACDGEWDPRTRRIVINTDQSQSSEIASFLHELGHSLGDLLFKDNKYDAKVSKAYKAVYSGKHRASQLDLVIKFEQTAWKNGRDIARRLKIPLGKWFDEAEAYCLSSYRST